LEQLNPGKTKNIRPGDQLMVPNVEPFDLVAIKDLKPGSDAGVPAANELPSDDNSPSPGTNDKAAGSAPAPSSVKIDTKTNMLGVFEADRLVAAYPVTIGSAQTASPIGDWKVTRIAKLPRFRYDQQMLKHGRRSGNFHVLPPGPNSPVGVIWMRSTRKASASTARTSRRRSAAPAVMVACGSPTGTPSVSRKKSSPACRFRSTENRRACSHARDNHQLVTRHSSPLTRHCAFGSGATCRTTLPRV